MFLYLDSIYEFMKRIIGFIISVMITQIAFSQANLNTLKMDSLLDVYEKKNKLMLSMAIRKDGNTIYKRAIGYSWIMKEGVLKSDPKTKYRIGSITKTFTAVMILQLVEEKKLKLNTPLSKFYPKLPNAKKITMAHLLMHRSGLHNFTDDAEYGTYVDLPKTHEEMLDIFYKLPSDFEPGSKYSYSNTNYVLLGYIIEKLRKMTYDEALKTNITNKIGLKNTYCGAAAYATQNECRSFTYNGKEWETGYETNMSIPGGAGALVSTAEDLTLFVESIFNYSLLNKVTVDLMSEQRDGYGMGLFTLPFYERTAFGHNGHIDNFTSCMFSFPEEKISFALSANGINSDLNEFMIGALSILFNKPYTVPQFYSIDVPEEVLVNYSGIYFNETMQLSFYITKEDNLIVGQAEGQSSFPLEAKTSKIFTYSPANIEIEFQQNENAQVHQFILKQNGMEFIFKKIK